MGKPETGTVSLRARHEGGQVIIEIADDGAGLNLEAIGAKVVDRGLMSAEAVAALSERELANLVFLPGLSTAKAVTKVSGRGVGMDVVKRSIDEIGGTIDIQTELGRGTMFTLRIPLTLAIIPALRVRCADERYLIPQLNVLELHRVDPTADAGGARGHSGSRFAAGSAHGRRAGARRAGRNRGAGPGARARGGVTVTRRTAATG